MDEALLATWPDGAALESFRIHADGSSTTAGSGPPTAETLEKALGAAIGEQQKADPVPEARVVFDGEASPWYTLCEVRAPDRPGLLHALAVAFSNAGADVHTARVTTIGGVAVDRFELTDGSGCKLDPAMEAAVREALATGASAARGRRRGHGHGQVGVGQPVG